MHACTQTQRKRVCVFSVFQFYLTQNFTDPRLTTVSQEDDKLQRQDVETSNTTSQCTTQYYQVVLNQQLHMSSDSKFACLAGWMQDCNVYANGYKFQKCLPATVILTDSVFPEPV
jgi:hypothetical protein